MARKKKWIDSYELQLYSEKVALIMTCTICVFMTIYNTHVIEELQFTQSQLVGGMETMKLYDREYIRTNRVEGIYYPDMDTMCVWVKDQLPEEINQTINHEYLHYLIDEEYCMDDGELVECSQHYCKR